MRSNTVVKALFALGFSLLADNSPLAAGATTTGMEQRVRASGAYDDLPVVQRESAAALFSAATRAQPAGRGFRAALMELAGADARLAEACRRRLAGGDVGTAEGDALRGFLSMPVAGVDAKLSGMAPRLEDVERRIGNDPVRSRLPDRALQEALGTWKVGIDQMTRLYDLREQFTVAPVAALAAAAGNSERAGLLTQRRRVAERAWQLRLELAAMDTVLETQLALLARALGRDQLQGELKATGGWKASLRSAPGSGPSPVQAALGALLEERRIWLAENLADMNRETPGTRSPLLLPPHPGAASAAPRLLAGWEATRLALIESLSRRHQTAQALLPGLATRNRLIVGLLPEAAGEAPVFDIMARLVETEDMLFGAIRTLGGQGPEGSVDLGMALDDLRLLEDRLLATVPPYLAAVVNSPRAARSPGLTKRLQQLARELGRGSAGPTEMARLAAQEQRTWADYERQFEQLLEARVGLWHSLASRAGPGHPAGDAISAALDDLLRDRLNGARADLDRFRARRDDDARDPILGHLYGRSPGLPWQGHALEGDYVRQAWREIAQGRALTDWFRMAADTGSPQAERAIALINIAAEAALPWAMTAAGDNPAWHVQVAGREFRIDRLAARTPGLTPARPRTSGPSHPILLASRLALPALLAAGDTGEQPGLASNLYNGIAYQARKNTLTYAIIGIGGIAAAIVAGPVLGAGAAAVAILQGTAISAGIQVWQDVNFGAVRGYAETYYSPQEQAAVRENLYWGEILVDTGTGLHGVYKGVKGLATAGEAAQRYQTAERALAAAQSELGVTDDLHRTLKNGYQAAADFVMHQRRGAAGTQEAIRLMGEGVAAERRMIDAVTAAQEGVEAAEQALNGARQAIAASTSVGAGGFAAAGQQLHQAGQGSAAADVVGAAADLSGPASEAVAPEERDSDWDGTPDSRDGCAADPAKQAPGLCGCGVADTDSDGDGIPDCIDQCPQDAAKKEPGVCGCAISDQDRDGDGTPDCDDRCPDDTTKQAPGVCGCGVSDQDRDGDGSPDCIDQCPEDPAKQAPGRCGCGTADIDSDQDGSPDCTDACPEDANKLEPGQCGCGIADTDADNNGIADCKEAKTGRGTGTRTGGGAVGTCPEGTTRARDGSCVQMTEGAVAIQMHGAVQSQRPQTPTTGTATTPLYGPRPGRISPEEMHAGMRDTTVPTWDEGGSSGPRPGTAPGTTPPVTPAPGTGPSPGGPPTTPSPSPGGSQEKAWYGIEVVYSYKMGGTPCTSVQHFEAFMTRAEAQQMASKESANTGALLRGVERTDIRVVRAGIYAGPSTTKPTYTGGRSQCGQATSECSSNAQCWSKYGSDGYYCNPRNGACVRCPAGQHGRKDGTPECHGD